MSLRQYSLYNLVPMGSWGVLFLLQVLAKLKTNIIPFRGVSHNTVTLGLRGIAFFLENPLALDLFA